jgi:hypothetical protein
MDLITGSLKNNHKKNRRLYGQKNSRFLENHSYNYIYMYVNQNHGFIYTYQNQVFYSFENWSYESQELP